MTVPLAAAALRLTRARGSAVLQGLIIVGSASHNTPETQAFVSDYKARLDGPPRCLAARLAEPFRLVHASSPARGTAR